MSKDILIEEEKYEGNRFFEPIFKRRGFWAYRFVGDPELLIENGASILEGLNDKGQLIFEDTQIKLWELSMLDFKGRRVRVSNVHFVDNELKIKNAKINFVNCTFPKTINFTECNLCRIDLIRCKTVVDVNVYICDETYFNIVCDQIKRLDVSVCIKSKFRVVNCSEINVNLEGNELGEFRLEDSKLIQFHTYDTLINELNLFNVSSDKEINIRTQAKEKDYVLKIDFLNIVKCQFSKLVLKNEFYDLQRHPVKINLSESNDISIFYHHLEELRLNGEFVENVKFYSCRIDSLLFDEFSSKNNVKFQKCACYIGSNKLQIKDSILKGVEINPSFLEEFATIDFRGSTISGIELYNFEPIKQVVIKTSDMPEKCKIDFCRELNFLMISQNNKHYATLYRALELEIRTKEYDDTLSLFDKIVLNLNHWSNVHGTMPQKALFWILIFIVFQFGFINLDIAIQTNIPYEAGFDFLKQNYSYFIKPFTFLTDVEGDYKPFGSDNMKINFSWWVKGFDFLYKIFYAYLLYQFIAAFRKFNK